MDKRRTILLVLRENAAADELIESLTDDFELIISYDAEGAFDLVKQNLSKLAAVLVDFVVAKKTGFSIIKRLSGNAAFAAIPEILVMEDVPGEEALKALSLGYSDLIYPPFVKPLVVKRILNAIQAKDSLTFSEVEKMLQELPSIIYLKDTQCRYVFVSQRWYQLHGHDEPDWSVRGKTELEIRKNRENAYMAMESDRRLLETGEGTSYIIEENEGGRTEYFNVIKRATHDKDGKINGIVALINNVTNRQLLKMELEKRSKTDLLTGLLNKQTAEDLVREYVGRKDVPPCALYIMDIDRFKSLNDAFGHAAGDRVLSALGRVIGKSFPESAVIGRIGGDEFMALVREIPAEGPLAAAERLLESVRSEFSSGPLAGRVSLSVGVSVFPNNGADFDSLYSAADSALYYVKEHGRNGAKQV